jgi:C-terminal processing protease CtpA/Prc
MVLEDQEDGFVKVVEVAAGSNSEKAGVLEGDLLRAATAVQMQMSTPTWQLLVGGIGQPKSLRFMYTCDQRPFEEVMDALGSNRMDGAARPVVLAIERRR